MGLITIGQDTLGSLTKRLAAFASEEARARVISGLSGAVPFFRALIADPRLVGAIVPSGRALAQLITAEISPGAAPVIELGPGTGAFTRELLIKGIPEDQIILVEADSKMARGLRQRFPSASVHRMDAARLRQTPLFDGRKAGAVVSGLPLLLMSRRQVVALLKGVFLHLRPDGALYQFTYGPQCPIPRVILARLGLKASRIGGTVANCPPAAVYRIRRRRALTI
jgi:phosphatidylethanolamine/phosphatidyl-N-methylethanolamine N-methyltransferase